MGEKQALGCLFGVLYAVFSVTAAMAVGLLAGAGWGFAVLAAFALAALAAVLSAYKQQTRG